MALGNGDTFEAHQVKGHIMRNNVWVNKLKTMNERDRYIKARSIIPAACREMKLKLTEDEQHYACFLVSQEIKELA